MSVIATRKLAEIAERISKGEDPKKTVVDAIGKDRIAQFSPAPNQVLVGTYVRSEKTKSGLFIGGDRTRAEDRFQGKVGLVLKVGPNSFQDDNINKFGGFTAKVGDWVMYRTADAFELFFVDSKSELDGTSARLISDVSIKAVIEDPASVY